MRLILKILAVPFVVALTLAAAFFAFLLHFSSIIFGLASTLLFLFSVALLITKAYFNSGAVLVLAFLVSPFGLPMLAVWIVGGLDRLNGALKDFITS